MRQENTAIPPVRGHASGLKPMIETKPQALYKYLPPERAFDVLSKSLIRFSQASVLNDALEFRPSVNGMGSPEVIKAGLLERLQQREPELVRRIRAFLPEGEAMMLIEELLSDSAKVVASPEHLTKSEAEVYRQLDCSFGVLSLSERPDSELMWSHYADGGRGSVLEFDPVHPWFWAKRDESHSFRHLQRVDYVDCEPGSFLGMSDQTALYTKRAAWSYEKEWRIIRNFNDAAAKCGPDSYGKDVLLFAVPPECIRSVLLGYKASAGHMQQLRESLARTTSLSHVTLQRAVLRSNGSIAFVPFA